MKQRKICEFGPKMTIEATVEEGKDPIVEFNGKAITTDELENVVKWLISEVMGPMELSPFPMPKAPQIAFKREIEPVQQFKAIEERTTGVQAPLKQVTRLPNMDINQQGDGALVIVDRTALQRNEPVRFSV